MNRPSELSIKDHATDVRGLTMIVPLVAEPEWADFLRDLTLWEPPLTSTVVIAPHPDDETLAAGGLIAFLRERGIDVVVVAVTDGENAYADTPGLGELRRVEQSDAIERLGVPLNKIVRLGLPDSDVSAHEDELIARMLPLISADTHIVAPWHGDFHPDHEACGRAAKEVASRSGAALTSYFFWMWHRGTPDLLDPKRLRAMKLSDHAFCAKSAALECHRSQLAHSSGEPILPSDLLGPAQRKFEVFLIP